ncbi:MAG: hypothetical protein IKL89_07465 [Clostridia bacterium]|nr:hypothetical protein [Clostridia bacterium]
MPVTEKIVRYGGFGRCLRIENGDCELIVTLAIGPRIIRYAKAGGKNFFFEDKKCTTIQSGPVMDAYYGDGAYWRIWGGHRIWYSPEAMPDSYYPDNGRVRWGKEEDGTYIFVPKEQKENGVAYTMKVKLADKGTDVRVTLQIKNIGKAPKTYGVWSITAMAKGGMCAIPTLTEDTGLLHNRSFSFWAYSKLDDARFHLGNRFITLRQNQKADGPFKIGLKNDSGLGAYFLNGDLFVKKAAFEENMPYPDNGCNYETYTNPHFLELETLGPLVERQPGEVVEHVEDWKIIENVARPDRKDEDALAEIFANL